MPIIPLKGLLVWLVWDVSGVMNIWKGMCKVYIIHLVKYVYNSDENTTTHFQLLLIIINNFE